MATHRPRLRRAIVSGAAIASLVVGLGAVTGVTPALAAQSGAPCSGKHVTGAEVNITAPVSPTTVDLTKTPNLTVKGQVEGANSTSVTAVDLYGDGTLVSHIVLPSPSRSTERSWQTSFIPPFGNHAITACITTASGLSGSNKLAITVVTPPTTATILTADAHPLSSTEQAAITSVTATTVTIAAPPIPVGKVIVADTSDIAPLGLMRRITAAATTGTTTTYTTVNASLTDIFEQATVDQTGAPFQDIVPSSASTTIKPTIRTAVGAASVTGTKRVNVPLWDLSFKDSQSVSKTVKPNEDLKISGNVTVTEAASSKASASFTFRFKISLKVSNWTLKPSLDSASLIADGNLASAASLDLKGSGSLTYKATDFVPPHQFAPIDFQVGPVPVVVVPTVNVDFTANANINADATFAVNITGAFTAGVQYANGQVSPVSQVTQNVTVTTPFGSGFTASAGAGEEFDPKLTFLIYDVSGPYVATALGAEISAKVPTPCRVTGDVYTNFSLGARIAVFDKTLADVNFPVAEAKLPFLDQPLPFCSNPSPTPTPPTGSVAAIPVGSPGSFPATLYFGPLADVVAQASDATFGVDPAFLAANPNVCAETVVVRNVTGTTAAVFAEGFGSGWTAGEPSPSQAVSTDSGVIHQQLILPPVGVAAGSSYLVDGQLVVDGQSYTSSQVQISFASASGTTQNWTVGGTPVSCSAS